MNEPQILGVEFLSILVTFDCPVDRNLYDFGALTLECEGRNFILDVCKSYTNEESTEIVLGLEVDTDIFPVSTEYNYELTKEDLYSSKLTATLFVGGEDYEVEPECMTFFIKSGLTTKAIDVKIED
jgi:hypothetical protein